MLRPARWFFAVAALIVLPVLALQGPLLSSAAEGQDAEPARGDDRGYIALFDGQSLAGWHTSREEISHGTGGQWGVEDGAMVGQQDPPGSGNGGILLTDQMYGDFELLVDLRPDWGICTGVLLRTNEQGQGYQVMVDYHDGGNIGHIYGAGIGGFTNRPFDIVGIEDESTGQMIEIATEPNNNVLPKAYSISGEAWQEAWKLGDWNTLKIRVVGNPPMITTWLNGEKVSEFNGKTYDALMYDPAKTAEQLGPQGHIALLVHGGKGWPIGAKCRWRNIRIKPL